jgi:hypothetical protein
MLILQDVSGPELERAHYVENNSGTSASGDRNAWYRCYIEGPDNFDQRIENPLVSLPTSGLIGN